MTAVEFIFEELENRENGYPHFTMQQIYNKAKEMEKQQIIDAHLNGQAEFHKGQFKREYCLEFWTYEFIETYSKEERLIKEIELEFKYEPRYNSRWKTN